MSSLPKVPSAGAANPRSPANPIEHGLETRFVVLNNESAAAFDGLVETFRCECLPVGQIEERLVFEMALAQWRLQRCWACEAALFDNQMDHQASELEEKYESVDEPTRQALALRALSDESQSFELFGRREARLRNFFSRALRELQKLQALRRAPTPPPAPITAGQPSHDPHSTTHNPAAALAATAKCTNKPNPKNGHQSRNSSNQTQARQALPPSAFRLLPSELAHQAPQQVRLDPQPVGLRGPPHGADTPTFPKNASIENKGVPG